MDMQKNNEEPKSLLTNKYPYGDVKRKTINGKRHYEGEGKFLPSVTTIIGATKDKKDLAGLAAQFFKRFVYILDQESVPYEEKAVADLIMKYAPDWRRVINEGQRRSIGGSRIDGSNHRTSDSSFAELATSLKDKNLSDEVKNKITNKLIELNKELEKIEKKLSKKQVLENFAKETSKIYEKADRAFIQALDIDLESKSKK